MVFMVFAKPCRTEMLVLRRLLVSAQEDEEMSVLDSVWRGKRIGTRPTEIMF